MQKYGWISQKNIETKISHTKEHLYTVMYKVQRQPNYSIVVQVKRLG